MSRFAPVWFLVATAAFAQGTASSTAEKPAPPIEDAIEAAKRDFNTVKAARGAALQQPKMDLPSMSAPELQTAPAMPRLQATPKLDPKAARKSANWLVDAMTKSDEKELRDPHETIAESMLREREAADAKDPRMAKDARGNAARDENSPMAEKRVGPEFNPLSRYMAGWMTPQDYTLLKSGLDGAAAASLTSRGDPSLPSVGSDLSVLGDAGSALDLSSGTRTAPFALPKPSENPFLQSLTSGGAPATTSFAPPPAPSSVSTSPTLAPAPAPSAPTKSKIPDFAKPAMDEKYFKQLKRF